VSFTVTDFRGDPAAQTLIGASVRPEDSGSVFGAETDASGHASASGVAAGSYYLTVQPNRYLTDSIGPYYDQVVTIVAGQTADVAITLPASDWATGRVTNRLTHKGIGGVQVDARSQCQYAGDLCDSAFALTNAEGYYHIHSLIADAMWPSNTYLIYLDSKYVDSPLAKTYTVETQAGLGHDGLDITRLDAKSSLPST
jgi:hypothetical protein